MKTADPVADLMQAAKVIREDHPADRPLHKFWASIAGQYTKMAARQAANTIVTADDWALWHAMVGGARAYLSQGGNPRRLSVRLRLRYLSAADTDLTREQAVRAACDGQPVTVRAVRLGQPLTAQVLPRGAGVQVDWPGNVAAEQASALSLVIAEAAWLAAIADQEARGAGLARLPAGNRLSAG